MVRFFHSLAETEAGLKTAAHPRYQLEIGLVKLIEMRRLAPLNQILERLSALEESLRTGKAPASGGSAPPAAAAGGGSQAAKPKRGSGSFSPRAASAEDERSAVADVKAFADEAPFGGVGGSSQQQQPRTPLTLVQKPAAPTVQTGSASSSSFPEEAPFDFSREPEDFVGPSAPAISSGDSFVEKLKAELEKRKRMFLAVAIEGARRALLQGEELYIEFAPEAKHLRDQLSKPDSIKTLREASHELLGRDIGFRITVKEHGATIDEPLSKQEEERLEKQRLREAAEKHPMVQELLRTFRGEIVDVRRVDE